MKTIETIEHWVKEHESLYLFLPDGPYGRPFDNEYSVKSIQQTKDGFDIQFIDGECLKFHGKNKINSIKIKKTKLSIGDFEFLTLTIDGVDIRSFTDGEVLLIAT